MLTDYHVHLRPDTADASAERYFTAANAERYREAATERGIDELGVSEHIYRFSEALDDLGQRRCGASSRTTTSTPTARSCARRPTCGSGSRPTSCPGREDRVASFLRGARVGLRRRLDPLRRRRARSTTRTTTSGAWAQGPEKVWSTYFTWLGELARTGMYDILAHPDLVKHWGGSGRFPDGDLRRFYELAMDGIAESQIAIEVSTAGLRKPVGELYPSAAFLEMCLDAGCPVALSSDAHTPEHLGFGYEEALALPRRARRDRARRVRASRAPPGADR